MGFWIPFYKSGDVARAEVAPDVVKEEARLAELRRLYDKGLIDMGQYMDAIRGLKATVEASGKEYKGVGALDILQLGLLAAIVGGVVYGIKQFK